jgi:hypothetical protein
MKTFISRDQDEDIKFDIEYFLVQQKRFLLNHIFQITQFDNESKSLFKKFHHIYFINSDSKNFPQLSVVDISTSCCVLIPNSIKIIPKGYFFDNPRFTKDKEGKIEYDQNIPLQGFSLNMMTFDCYANIMEVEEECFFGCESLKEIHLSNPIAKIGQDCFNECSSLFKVNLPDMIKELPEWCFYKCQALKNIHLPNSITIIGKDCFNRCSTFVTIYLWDSLSKLS